MGAPTTRLSRTLRHAAIRGGLEAVSLVRAVGLGPVAAGRGIVFTLHHVRPAAETAPGPNAHLSVTPEFLSLAIETAEASGLTPVALEDLPRLLADPDDPRRFVEDRRCGKVVAKADLTVVRVVCRRHLHCAGAECRVDEVVADDRNRAIHERNDDPAADQVGVARIARVHRHGGVSQHGLGTRCRDDDPLVRTAALQGVADLPDAPALFDSDRFEVRHARLAAGTPVDECLRAICETAFVQSGECRPHGTTGHLVHRESRSTPVSRGAETTKLREDHAARLLHESIHSLQVALSTQAAPALPLVGDDLVQYELRRDGGVVDAREPERGPPAHPCPTRQQVFERDEERMSHVQAAGDVRWRHDDRERR